MKKFYIFIITLLFFINCPVFAQSGSTERIEKYSTSIKINKDSSINVIENIIYNSGIEEKHGIYRNIILRSSQDRKLVISDIEVSEINDSYIPFDVEYPDSRSVSLKIGYPEITFMGQKTYQIKYKINKAIGYFDNFDELYWNVTGNDWNMPITEVTADITYEDGLTPIQSACYYGATGSKQTCLISQTKDINSQSVLSYKTVEVSLGVSEGLTIAVGFPKGQIDIIKPGFFEIYGRYFGYIFIVLPLYVFWLMFKKWKKDGKDPISKNPLIAQYDVPDNLSPVESSAVLFESVSGKSVTAQIIYWAIKGAIKIERTEDKVLFFKKHDYILKKLVNDNPQDEINKNLFKGLFSDASQNSVKLSSLDKSFYKYFGKITSFTFKKVIKDGYLKNNPSTVIGLYILIAFFVFVFSIIIGSVLTQWFGPTPLVCGLITAVIVFIFGILMPARTEKGLLTKEYLLGLKLYLQIAEKNRLDFHNAPEKNPQTFEKLLPFAIVMGVEKAWAKEFEGIYKEPPKWYSDPNMGTFSAVAFTNSLNGFVSSSNLSLVSSTAGSSGGGSSGGGGGGGGGGSW